MQGQDSQIRRKNMATNKKRMFQLVFTIDGIKHLRECKDREFLHDKWSELRTLYDGLGIDYQFVSLGEKKHKEKK